MVKMKKGKLALLVAGTVLGTVLMVFAGLFVYSNLMNITYVPSDEYSEMKEISDKYAKLYDIQNTIEEKFFGEVDEAAQMNAIYLALLNSLDDKYAEYYDEDAYAELTKFINGYYVGVGITVKQVDEGFAVGWVESGGPAEKYLKVGDLIISVDGKEYDDLVSLSNAIKGDEGTSVVITYSRDGKQKEAEMTRAKMDTRTVYSSTVDSGEKTIGYIKITSFEKNTAKQFRTELANMENKNVDGLVVDLRQNAGGLLNEAIDIADALLPSCTITETINNGGKSKYYNSDSDYTKLKYVFLTDEYSASASEVLAAAVKDNGGGAIVGKKTFGKGIIQEVTSFGDGTGMKITVEKYLSPKGSEINGVGITPDYEVDAGTDGGNDLQLEKALELFT